MKSLFANSIFSLWWPHPSSSTQLMYIENITMCKAHSFYNICKNKEKNKECELITRRLRPACWSTRSSRPHSKEIFSLQGVLHIHRHPPLTHHHRYHHHHHHHHHHHDDRDHLEDNWYQICAATRASLARGYGGWRLTPTSARCNRQTFYCRISPAPFSDFIWYLDVFLNLVILNFIRRWKYWVGGWSTSW